MKTFIKNLLMGICFTVGYIGYCHSGTIDPSVPDAQYIEYGKAFKCIYKICGSYNDKGLFCASCVIIDKQWALTSAHVVQNSNLCVIHQGDEAYIVDKIIVHEDFKSDSFGYNDIALCHVSKNITLDYYPPLYDKDDELNKLCSISGYGITGTFVTGAKISDNIKRAGSNKIDYIEKDLLMCSPSKSRKTSLEFLIASGDSGGGLFIDQKLAGINSCVIASDKKPNSTYGDESGHIRISKYIKWINNNILLNK